MNEEHWHESPERDPVASRSNRMGTLNMALLFGTAAIALTLIVTPMLAPGKSGDRMQASTMDYDNITTGSVPSADGKTKRYTIRRSVLSENPGDVCIIGQDGTKTGC
ncbi:MAG: hypothetical protein KL863_25160 [Rhizobium sp.]|nr:hypothetical protein [Rhizobium sp.]MBX9459054.1 hypothetical protein [Rhizobium sp.]